MKVAFISPALSAKPFYHRLHVIHAELMRRLTDDPVIDSEAKSWQAYAEPLMVRSFGR